MEYAYGILQTPESFEEFCEFVEGTKFEYSSDTIQERLRLYTVRVTERQILNKIFLLRASEIEKTNEISVKK